MPIGETFEALPAPVAAAKLTRGYAANRQEGGSGGNLERPLVGLLHPPARRGNRASAS